MPDGWSGWRPTADDGEKAAAQIATHVGRKYRLADGSQLVGVQGGPLEIDALGLTVPLEIAMKSAPQGGDIDFIKGNGLLYTLNGLGPKGSVRGGKPSEERAPAAAPRGARAGPLLVPLHRRRRPRRRAAAAGDVAR